MRESELKMYIAIFVGEKNDNVLEVRTLSDVLMTAANIMMNDDCKWGDIGHLYDDKEEFVKDIDDFMSDNVNGYVIGVDVEKDSFEIMEIKYEWVIKSRTMTPENLK
jgi:hypothetical protein